jgi:group I intron endonuclease
MYIYKITNKINNKIYIGQTIGTLVNRFRFHVNSANNNARSAIHRAIIKYGKENFIIEELARASSRKELNELEIKFIQEFNSLSPIGYNLKRGGHIQEWHPEMRAKASVSAKARIQADNGAQLKKFHAAGQKALQGKDPWNKGKKATEEARRNQSLAHLGKPAPNKTPVFCNETGQIFMSIREAAIKLKLQPSHICNTLKGIRKHTGGFTFQYLKKE